MSKAEEREGPGSGRPFVESVLRALRLLECFAPGEPQLPLGELVRRSGYSKSTTYRLLRTLEHAGWLERADGGEFRLTVRPFQVGSILVDDLELRKEAHPILVELAGRHDLTTFLIVPGIDRAVCIDRVDGGGVRFMYLEVGGSIPYHLGAGPRCLLAYREAELLPLLESTGELERYTSSSITDLALIRRDLAEIRDRGFAFSGEDVTEGVVALGAPIFDRGGTAVGSLSISGLSPSIDQAADEIAADLIVECRSLSERMGFEPEP